jgi:hypothetical protein
VIRLDSKLERIRELINTKEKVDAELERLMGGQATRRGRPRQEATGGLGHEGSASEPERPADDQG